MRIIKLKLYFLMVACVIFNTHTLFASGGGSVLVTILMMDGNLFMEMFLKRNNQALVIRSGAHLISRTTGALKANSTKKIRPLSAPVLCHAE